jgi:superfamily II DNA or RNA helicase
MGNTALMMTQVSQLKLNNKLESGQDDQESGYKLRDYQIKAIKDIYKFYKSGLKMGMLYAPTGAGKTVMATQIIEDAVTRGKRVLFCCHRTKLVLQTIATLEKHGIQCGAIWSDRTDLEDLSAPVQVAMIQSLQNKELPEDIDLVIFDECHSSIYWQISIDILNKYSGGIYALSKCWVLGLTATPWRTKKKEGYCQFFQFIVRCPDPIDLINSGYLVNPRLFGYGGIIDFSKLSAKGGGDYSEKSLKSALNETYNEQVVINSLSYIQGKKGILIGANVKQCESLNTKFIERGIKSKVIIGSTSEEERDVIFNELREGKIDLICSVNCLCEGFDEPSLEYVIIARPTRSQSLLIQICGRGLRLFPDKKECLLLDFGECFNRVCRPTDKLLINLCPKDKIDDFSPLMKLCPKCKQFVNLSVKICPHCGEEFLTEEKARAQVTDYFPTFGELLSKEEREQLKYVRSQMRSKYTRGQNPWKVKINFQKRFKRCAPDDWFVGAIFGEGIRDEKNKELYANFLRGIHPSDSFVKKMIELEFGNPNKTYTFSGDCEDYNPSRFYPKGKTWDEVFGVPKNTRLFQIKKIYRQLALKYHPDHVGSNSFEIEMKILNQAYETAKKEAVS